MTLQTAINYLLWARGDLRAGGKSMAYNRSYDTDDGAIPAALRRSSAIVSLSFRVCCCRSRSRGRCPATWSVDDPSFNHANQIAKLPRLPGAAIADELMQLMGLACCVIGIPMAWVVTF
jgi:hypothetical protein